jgi:hypothetical protein
MSLSDYVHDSSAMIIALADRLRLPAVYRIPQFAQRGVFCLWMANS